MMSFPYNDEIMLCRPLPNGNIVFNECGAGRITEINREGKVVWSLEVQAKGKEQLTARFIRLTPQNTVLVGECYSHELREHQFDGMIVKEWDLMMDYSGSRLANGNTLISGYKPPQLVEWTLWGKRCGR